MVLSVAAPGRLAAAHNQAMTEPPIAAPLADKTETCQRSLLEIFQIFGWHRQRQLEYEPVDIQTIYGKLYCIQQGHLQTLIAVIHNTIHESFKRRTADWTDVFRGYFLFFRASSLL